MATESRIDRKDDGYYEIVRYYTSHTGVVSIKVKENDSIEEGDVIYTITRLGLIKKKTALVSGVIKNINKKVDNQFCGYYTHVLDLERKLTPEEAEAFEEEKEYIFVYAPQGAQYYLKPTPALPPMINVGDIVEKGDVIAIALVMKKRKEIIYDGKRGKIAKIYFQNGQQCREGDKLFGIIPKSL